MANGEKRREGRKKRITIDKGELEEMIGYAIKRSHYGYFIEMLDGIDDDTKSIKRIMRVMVKKEEGIEGIEEGYGSLEELESIMIKGEDMDLSLNVFDTLAGKDHKSLEEQALITALVNTGKLAENDADERIKSSLAAIAIYEVRRRFYNTASVSLHGE
jgi:hypothetical protein